MMFSGFDRLPVTLQLRRCIHQSVNPNNFHQALSQADVPARCPCSHVQCLRLMLVLRFRRHLPV